MPPKPVTLAAFLPAQLKPQDQAPESAPLPNGQPRPPPRCRCEGAFDLCWRYPAGVNNAACRATWDRLLAPFQFKGREWTIVELRSLWPHTVQALNERLQKGRMERTLKDDLQDDLQVMVDLIQHSCKPHPRPPRAGMKTLIVQGRILAEAIAQDALFQLDPSDPSAPRPDRDLVDLINRLGDHHPNSLLAPALHVLRTLGNTAVHLDRDSARLTDAEIGDAAAVCCRFVVLVVDAYMQMCANLHKHDETEEALAQPLLEAPVAPIPAPNVLLRPREPAAPSPEESVGSAAATASPLAQPQPAAVAPPRPTMQSSPPDRVLLQARDRVPVIGTAVGSGGDSGGCEDDELGGSGGGGDVPGARRESSGGGGGGGGSTSGGRRSCAGTIDGATGRVPYSLVSNDWSAVQQHPHVTTSSSGGGGFGGYVGGGNGGCSPQGQHPSSRGWWPPATAGEAGASVLSTSATALGLQGTDGGGPGPEALPAARMTPPPVPLQQPTPLRSPSFSNRVQGHPMLYGLPGASPSDIGAPLAITYGRLPSGSNGSCGESYAAADVGVAIAVAAPPALLQHARASAHPPGPQPTAPYTLTSSGSICSAAAVASSTGLTAIGSAATTTAPYFPASTAAPPGEADPWVQSGSENLAGSSPRRFPISLTSGGDATGDHAAYTAVRGSSPTSTGRGNSSPGRLQPPRPSASQPNLHPAQQQQYHHSHQQQQQQQQQQLLLQHLTGSTGAGPGSGPGPVPGPGPGLGCGGSAPQMGAAEASKRLLQLCATAQAPPAAKVERLLQAGASLNFTDKSGMTALHMACYWCHMEAARLLLAAHPGAAAAADREGRTPLWVASQRGHVELVEMLLGRVEGVAQVDVPSATVVTPLRVAAAQGHSQVVAALLQAGANVDAADKDGYTPLYVSSARSQLEVVRLLLAARPNVDRTDRGGRTPLWAALHPGGAAKAEACPERRSAVVRSLLSAGADVYLLTDARDRDYCWQLLAQSIAAGE